MSDGPENPRPNWPGSDRYCVHQHHRGHCGLRNVMVCTVTAAERNRVIAEAIGEKGYVECPLCLGAGRLPVDRHFTQRKCSLCNGVGNIRSPIDFASPSGFWVMWEWLPSTNGVHVIGRANWCELRQHIADRLLRVSGGWTYQLFLTESADIVAMAILGGKEMEDGHKEG